MNILLVLLRKEWEDAFRNRMVLFTILGTPLILVLVAVSGVLPMGMLEGEMSPKDMQEMMQLTGGLCQNVSAEDCLPLYMASLMMMIFLVLPTVLPSVIAAYAVVGEKNERTLEPLLATPIRTVELLGAKVAAAVLPSVASTWAAAALFLGILGVTRSLALVWTILTPAWVASLGGGVPLLAVGSVLVAIMVSSRSTDPRSAQQVSGIVVMPVVGMLVAQSLGVMLVRPVVVYPALGVLVGVDLVLLWLAVQLFERETILTRWTGL